MSFKSFIIVLISGLISISVTIVSIKIVFYWVLNKIYRAITVGQFENTLAAVMQRVLLPQSAFAGHRNTVFGPFKMLLPTQ
jgi:succinate dehydrogenase hydrophobic anchor subunit